MEREGRSPLQAMQDYICPRWTSTLFCPARSLSMHSMAVLQVFQAKLLQCMDESGPVPAAFKELRSATDLALRATKTTAQAIGRSMASLVVLERHFWLNLTEIKEADKVPFLDSPVSSTGLFRSSIAKAGSPRNASLRW